MFDWGGAMIGLSTYGVFLGALCAVYGLTREDGRLFTVGTLLTAFGCVLIGGLS